MSQSAAFDLLQHEPKDHIEINQSSLIRLERVRKNLEILRKDISEQIVQNIRIYRKDVDDALNMGNSYAAITSEK